MQQTDKEDSRHCFTEERPHSYSGKPSMHVDLLHATIGLLFLAVWAMIGHFCVLHRKPRPLGSPSHAPLREPVA